MALTTYVEAIRQGIWEEMERDESVFVLGEDVGIYGGAFKVTAGMLEKFGELACCRYAHFGVRHRRRRDRRRADGDAARRRNAVCRLHFLRLRPDHELRREVPVSLGRTRSDGHPRAQRRRHSRRPVSLAESGDVFRPYAGPESRLPVDGVRREGLDQVGHSRQRSGAVFRAQVSVSPHQGRTADGRLHRPDWQGHHARKGRDISVITYGAMVYIALDAAKELEKEGIDLEVIDLRSLLPFDRKRCWSPQRRPAR